VCRQDYLQTRAAISTLIPQIVNFLGIMQNEGRELRPLELRHLFSPFVKKAT
jgi:hypothetical protein